MAATVYISETNGANASPVVTDNVANLNFGAVDSPNIVPALNPINVGSYSVAKWWRVKLASLGGSSQVGNIKIWKSSGAYVTGETIGGTLVDGNANMYCTAYGQATVASTLGAVTVPYTGNGTAVMGAGGWAGFPTVTAAANNVAVGGVMGGNIVGVGYSNYMSNALATTGSTPVGLVNQKVFTIQYDEA